MPTLDVGPVAERGVKYSPIQHNRPQMAALDGQGIEGQGAGMVIAALTDSRGAGGAWLATGRSPIDGQPTNMVWYSGPSAGSVG